jgi:hypothetical protein
MTTASAFPEDPTSSTITPSFNLLPAEVVLLIVDHLCDLPPEPQDSTYQDQISCPCTEEPHDPEDAAKIFPYGTRTLHGYQDSKAALLMVNRRTRVIVFEEKYKFGLKLALCEDVLEETREMPMYLRSTVR